MREWLRAPPSPSSSSPEEPRRNTQDSRRPTQEEENDAAPRDADPANNKKKLYERSFCFSCAQDAEGVTQSGARANALDFLSLSHADFLNLFKKFAIKKKRTGANALR